MFRVITIAREYGSGGGSIARLVAGRLGWDLLDRRLVQRIAEAAHVEPELARRFDERVDSWLHRISRNGLWPTSAAPLAQDAAVFDAETMVMLTRSVLEEAHRTGNYVIVGRGAQCILQDRDDVFHVFVYAPWGHRCERVSKREPGVDPEQRIRTIDRQRAEFIRAHFGCDWADRHMYHMLINSEMGDQNAAAVIVRGALGK